MIKVRHMAQVCRDVLATVQGTLPWDQLTDRQRRLSLTVVNFILANPDATPRSVHNAWMGEMLHNEGWVFGGHDEVAKRHPNLVSYEDLPLRILDSYKISIGIVRALQAIGDRYENCASPVAPYSALAGYGYEDLPLRIAAPTVHTAPAINTVIPSLIHPLSTATTDGGLTQEEIAQLTPTVPSDAQFTGQNQVVESGDVAAATDPASAE
jgi:hypothetical protein